jgi:hypothetical protein
MDPSQTKMGLPKKCIFSLIPLLFLLALIEVFFRLFPHDGNSERMVARTIERDPDLVWRLRPQPHGPYATNNLGFRDTKFNCDADIKILLLGNSVSWGDGVLELCDIYPSRIEQLLNVRNTGKTYEIINSSVPGYATCQQLRYLKLRGLKLNPYMIILEFCLNDITERYWCYTQQNSCNSILFKDFYESCATLYWLLIDHSKAGQALMGYLMKSARIKEECNVIKIAQDDLSPELQDAWQQALSEIDSIHEIASNNGIPFLLIIFPYRFQLDNYPEMRQPQQVLIKHCTERKIKYLDLLAYFASLPETHQHALFFDANHLTMLGHYETARILVTIIPNYLKDL